MGQGTIEKNQQTLQQLHAMCDFIDTSVYHKEINTFSYVVRRQMYIILKNQLNKKVKDWGEKCKKARLDSGYAQEDVAARMRIKHSLIIKQEKMKDADQVNPFYLEAFSLIYHKKPMILLGMDETSIGEVTVTLNSRASGYQNFILNSLYHPEDPESLHFLHTITKIGRFKYKAELMFRVILDYIPAIHNVLLTEPAGSPPFLSGQWISQYPMNMDYREIDSPQYAVQYLFFEVQAVTSALIYQNDTEMLKLMAQLASADRTLWSLCNDLLEIGQFAHDHRSNHTIPVTCTVKHAPENAKLTPHNYPWED